MHCSNYGITLINLTERDLELVRNWRNDPLVVRNHAFRQYISSEQQQQWFRSIRNIHHAYFVIQYQGKKVGVINARNIEWDRLEFESGIFIPDPLVYHTEVPAIVSVMATDLFFRIFRWKKIYAHILKKNLPVIRYNQTLGYELCAGEEEMDNQLYELTPDRFYRNVGKLLDSLPELTGRENTPVILIEPGDEHYPVVMQFEKQLLQGNPLVNYQTETSEGRAYYF